MLRDDLELACSLADAAEPIALAARERGAAGTRKPDGTVVTDADREIEHAWRAVLARERPADAVVGEELGDDGPAPRRWVLDPLDGTEHFLRGIPLWGHLIALEAGGEPVLGVVAAPALRRRWWAARGLGAWRDGKPLRVSAVTRLEDAFVAHANLFRAAPPELAAMTGVIAQAPIAGGYESFLAGMLVAEGAADAALHGYGELWDLAPARAIVEAAGGRVSAYGRGAVLSNGNLHDALIDALRR